MPKATIATEPPTLTLALGLLLAFVMPACTPADTEVAPDGAALDAPADAAPGSDAPATASDAPPTTSDAPGSAVCPPGGAGLACLFALWDALGDCDAGALAAFRASIEARHGDLPAWHGGRALFVSFGASAGVAGDWNGWDLGALVTAPLCATDLHVAETPLAPGRHEYKLVVGGVWQLDPEAWAFAYDEFTGNADGANSVVNTYDSGVGHLVRPDVDVCSAELANCRRFTAYLPRGYGAPANADRRYPVVFMHDGQNLYDDTDCCFGHTGWEVNVTLDAEIAAGEVVEAVIVGFDHAGAQRGDEYAYAVEDGGLREVFMAFQVATVQPTAAALWRLDPARTFTAGSSFGGLISYHLAFAYPDVYAGAASLSGAFWPGQDTGRAMRDVIAAGPLLDVALYLDHGGTAEDGGDGYLDNLEVRDLLVAKGWVREDSPACSLAPGGLCYHHEVGATHDELAWRDRSWRFLRYLLSP